MKIILIEIFDGLRSFFTASDAQSDSPFNKKDILPFLAVLIVLTLLECFICR